MNIIYFFVGDVQKHQDITIEYCPTDEMIGDFFTKPVEGAKFWRFRNIIMNSSHDEYGPVDVDELMAIHNEKNDKEVRYGVGRNNSRQIWDGWAQHQQGAESS